MFLDITNLDDLIKKNEPDFYDDIAEMKVIYKIVAIEEKHPTLSIDSTSAGAACKSAYDQLKNMYEREQLK